MSPDHGQAEPAHWSSYWARGCLTSLPRDFRENYDGEIAEFWRRQFSRLPDNPDILDVCTGNGAVALLAAAYFRNQGGEGRITGVDAATIDPDAVRAQHPGLADLVGAVDFISRVRFEALDWPDESVDLIVSQYGIEYCDWEPAAARVAALLRPGGSLAMVCHAVTTDILKTMEAEFREYDELMALDILPGLGAWSRGELEIDRLREILAKGAPRLRDAFNATGSGLYRYVLGLADRVLSSTDRELGGYREPLLDASRQLHDGHARLEDLLKVNRAIAASPEWHGAFERQGLTLADTGSLRYRNRHRAGDYYCYRKPDRG